MAETENFPETNSVEAPVVPASLQLSNNTGGWVVKYKL